MKAYQLENRRIKKTERGKYSVSLHFEDGTTAIISTTNPEVPIDIGLYLDIEEGDKDEHRS